MHTRIKILVSAGGMLIAGTALAANTTIVAGAAAPVTTSSSTAATSGSTPESSTPGSAASTIPDGTVVVGEPVPGSATQQSFRLGDAATVIVDTTDGRLTFVVIAPHPGWTLTRAEQHNSESLEIRLESPNGEVRFEADLVGGSVVTSLRNGDDNTSTTIGSGTTVNSGSTGNTVDDTSTTIGTGSTVSSGSTGTTVDDHGGDDNGGSGDDNSGSGNSGSGNSGSGNSGSGG